MKILLVSSYLPFPLFSGGHIRLYNLIKELSSKHVITLICEKREYQKESDIKEVEKFCKKVIAIPRKKQWSIKNILKTGASLSSFLITGHTTKQMKKEIQRELSENQFDLIHAETSYIMQNIPKTSVPLVLVEHNVEYLVYKRFADTAPLFLKPLLYLDVVKLKYWEEKMWKKATKLVAVSEVEKKIMTKVRRDVEIVANGVDIQKFKVPASQRGEQSSKFKVSQGERRILFIGDFKWMQNRNAVIWIIKEIWPKLREELIPSMVDGGIKLWVVGRNIPASIKKLTGDVNIVFDENAPKETEAVFNKSDFLLVPIRVGGGTSYKILEAMASGVPVITTPLGNSIDAKENSEIVIAEDSDEFVRKIRELLASEKFYKTISENARKLVEKNFNWQKISSDLERVYELVVYK